MTKVQPLAGNYTRNGKIFRQITGNALTGNGLMICKHALTTAKKPPTFLLWLDHLENWTYLSPLYPDGSSGEFYWFDYNRAKYVLRVKDETLTVTEVKK